MYNRYIPKGNSYERVIVQEPSDWAPPPVPEPTPFIPAPAQHAGHRSDGPPMAPPPPHRNESAQPLGGLFGAHSPLKGLTSLLGGGEGGSSSGDGILSSLSGILKSLNLENFDTGDILLVLIIIFLYLEGDQLEMLITLGLTLLMGL